MKRYMKVGNWSRQSRSRARRLPDYVPENIKEAYYQACAVAEISPDASSTISRFCLQQMVRDFWNIPKPQRGTLDVEINLVSEKMPPETIESISIATKFGNIGQAMSEDARRMMPTLPEEADMLIRLLETLFDDWYADREQRRLRSEALRRTAEKGQATATKALPPLDTDMTGSYLKQIEASHTTDVEPFELELPEPLAEIEPELTEPQELTGTGNGIAHASTATTSTMTDADSPSIAEIVRRI